MSDDRFARQNRFEPPPEFPLASFCTGIVHHLSGPNVYALSPLHCKQLERDYTAPLAEAHGSCIDRQACFTFIAPLGFDTQ